MLCYAPAPTAISALSLHDALPIFKLPELNCSRDGIHIPVLLDIPCKVSAHDLRLALLSLKRRSTAPSTRIVTLRPDKLDRKSTRLNSSHSQISYAVFCSTNKNN